MLARPYKCVGEGGPGAAGVAGAAGAAGGRGASDEDAVSSSQPPPRHHWDKMGEAACQLLSQC